MYGSSHMPGRTRPLAFVALALVAMSAIVALSTTFPFGGCAPAYADSRTSRPEVHDFAIVRLDELPQEARETVALMEKGPPFPFPRDGTVFKNREKRLPRQGYPDYYREFTVKTPGIQGSGPRRIVQGRDGELYYTDDHYQTFRLIRQESGPAPARGPQPDSVALTDLPREARDTLAHIAQGGPFPFHGDRSVFKNREKLLPVRNDPEYYRWYKVETPGDATSGSRRIVAGKGGERYYTDDRFRSFKLIKE
jgi:ribonuclease T1